MAASLESVNRKIARAREHLERVQVMAEAFRTVIPEFDRERPPGSVMLMVSAKLPPAPPELGPLIGDCVHNLRCALDHLIWQLVIANRREPTRRNMFPVCENAPQFQKQLERGRLDGVCPNAQKLVERFQPFADPANQPLFTLTELDNIDKHRFLLVTGCVLTEQQLTLTSSGDPSFRWIVGTSGAAVRSGSPIFGFNPEKTPMGTDFRIEGTQIASYLAFDDAPVRNEDVAATLVNLADYVETTLVPAFGPFIV